jgi:hypothetical protein
MVVKRVFMSSSASRTHRRKPGFTAIFLKFALARLAACPLTRKQSNDFYEVARREVTLKQKTNNT